MIRIKNLSKRYSRKGGNILDGISFDFPDRGFFAIVGESGSGKSTFLYSLSGMVPFSGDVELFSKGTDLEAARREDIGFVFQDFRLPDSMGVLRSVMDGCICAGIDEAEAFRRAIHPVPLPQSYRPLHRAHPQNLRLRCCHFFFE